MSRIFQTIGVERENIPLLWISAPLSGLVVQPIVGYLNDNTWHPKFGRRRPYFLIGAILSSIALFVVPHSPLSDTKSERTRDRCDLEEATRPYACRAVPRRPLLPLERLSDPGAHLAGEKDRYLPARRPLYREV